MSAAAVSLLVFGIYLLLGGLVFAIEPNVPLGLLGVPTTDEPWIRVIGVLMLAIGYYYVRAARANDGAFLLWTVQARIGVFVAFVLLVLLGWSQAQLIIFAVVDLLGALWTYLTMRRE